ncbi:MAG: DUF4178 domain-containing protein [Deltaproteobacteria bacterium]|nr:DUF4178 domain-containing protein [Deltaproteobacteria bacterium]
MARQITCPNCGGSHDLVNPGISMLVCEYCQTTLYWSEDAAVHMGQRSILPQGDTRLYMGATGKLLERSFEVVGHVRLEVDRGGWDEWYLMIDGQKSAWVSEDGRQLALARSLKVEEALPRPDEIDVGYTVRLSGMEFTVREIGEARCVGGEGQLPFTLLPGEQYPFLDLATADGQHNATLEFDEEEAPHAYLGRTLSHEQLVVDDDRSPIGPSQEAKDVDCPNCGGPVERPKDRDVATLVCTYCGAHLDLSGTEMAVMGINPKGFDPNFLLEIGQKGKLRGVEYEVSGRVLVRDEEGYDSREYILYNPGKGYLWLAEENGHFVLSQNTRQAPKTHVFNLEPKYPVMVGDQEFLFFGEVRARIVYVDGALPWVANANDSFKAACLIAPPRQFGIESGGSGRGVDYFIGDYMAPEQVWEAFKLKPPVWEAAGVHPAQPFVRNPKMTQLMWVGLVFAALNLLGLSWSVLSESRPVYQASLGPSDYSTERLSKPFAISGGGVMRLKMSSPVRNNWVSLDVALVDAEDQVVATSGGDVEYYEGTEEGEHWTEGSSETEVFFKAPKAGEYRLLAKGSSGVATAPTDSKPSSRMSAPSGPAIQVVLYEGEVLSRYFFFAFLGIGLIPFYVWLRGYLFEKRRWAPAMDDDDKEETDWDDMDRM